MKIIGILLREKNEYNVINKEIINYLLTYDISLIGIIYNEDMDFNKIINVINLCNGIILPGGKEESYYPVKIAKYLWQIDKPTFGICLGMQQMAEAFNGNLEKIDTCFHNSNLTYVHKINIKKDSLLYNILQSNNIFVNSRHSYNVVNTNLSVSAYSEDYIIEAIEDKTKKFYLGIQWHPESLINDLNSRLLLDAFIKKC